nr:putative ribonuclease H-like domain-containing protein [Tanacetum cinerariifolium]
MIVEENLHFRFSKSTPNFVGSGPNQLFDIDALTRTINYKPIVADAKSSHNDGFKPLSDDGKKVDEDPSKESECKDSKKEDNVNNTNNVNVVGPNEVNVVVGKTSIKLSNDPNMPTLEDVSIFNFSNNDEDDDAVVDMNNLDTIIQEELLQFMLQEVQTLVDLPNGKRAIGTKWVFRNKKDEGGIMIRNKARLVAQWYTQEKRIDYNEVFASVARIKAIRLFLAYDSFKEFMVYQMDVKSSFLYEKTKEEVYVCQPLGFEDPDFSDRVYKLKKALYGLHQAPRAWYGTLSTYLLDNGFQSGKIDKTLSIRRHKDNILLVQVYVDDIIFDKYVGEILKKFRFIEVKNASTPMETQKPLLKDEDGEEVYVHMYRYQVNLKVSHLYAVKRIFRKPKRKNTQVPQPSGSTINVVDEAVYKELDDILVRVATTASSLEVKQDSGNIDKTQSKATPNAASSLGTTSCGGSRCQDTMGDTIAQTRFKNVSKQSNDSLFTRGNTLQSDEDRMKLNDLMELCTNLQTKVLDLEKTKTTQALEITSLKRRDASKQDRISDIDADEDITLVNDQDDTEMFDIRDLHSEEVSVAGEVNGARNATTISAAATIATKEIDLAQKDVEIKTSKPKAKGSVLQEPKPVKPKKKEKIRLDENLALNLQAEFAKEERLAREKAQKEQEANIALIEEWDDVQAKIDLDEGISKRAGEELTQESAKKQKVEDNKETTKLKQLMKIIPDEEDVAIDAIPLAVKPPRID